MLNWTVFLVVAGPCLRMDLIDVQVLDVLVLGEGDATDE